MGPMIHTTKEVYRLVAIGYGPAEVMAELGINRHGYDTALAELVNYGAIGRIGDLPYGAETELCPTGIVSGLLIDIFNSTGWSDRITSSVKALCTRYGIVAPQTADPRYTNTRWTGQAYRRVDFTGADGIDYMVIGALMPRADKFRWKEGVPHTRIVYIESLDMARAFSMPRGGFVSDNIVAKHLSDCSVTNSLLKGLTQAVALVCEARTLFNKKMPD